MVKIMVRKREEVEGSDESTITHCIKKSQKIAIRSRVDGVEKGKVLKRGPWTPLEDDMLVRYVQSRGEKNWKNVQSTGLLRCGKSCRLRWTNHLRPDLKKGPFSFEEESIVFELHEKLGNMWSRIASKLPGRTDNEVKNFWNTKLKKRLISGNSSECHEQSEVNKISSNPLIDLQSTLPHFISSNEYGDNMLTSSTMHTDATLSFVDNSAYQFNFSFAQTLSPVSILANPFPSSNFLDFGTNLPYYDPNPLFGTQKSFESSIVLPSIQDENASSYVYNYPTLPGYFYGDETWTSSLSFNPDIMLNVHEQGSFVNGSNGYYDGLSTFEVASKEKLISEDDEQSMDDELSSLLNTFSSEGSPPEMPPLVENTTSNYYTHFYLDQPLFAFRSFSGARTVGVSRPESVPLTWSEFDCYIDGEESDEVKDQ